MVSLNNFDLPKEDALFMANFYDPGLE